MITNKWQPFTAAAARGLGWIIAQQREDGSFCAPEAGIGGYYKLPYALCLAGRLRAAQRLLAWAADHHFTAEGDFRAPERKAWGSSHDAWPVYGNAWLILGAHRAGRWDLSLRGAAFLQRYQVPAGGFYALSDGSRFLEPVCTSWGGLASLVTGHISAARSAGDLLVRLAHNQPDPARFYYRMDVEGSVVTAVPAGEELFYYVDTGQPQQIYFNPGIAIIFLTQLYLATAENNYLKASQTLFAFSERCAADVHRFPPSGKLGLGSALLYATTGNKQARQAAINVATYLCETQSSEGFWRLPDVAAYRTIVDKDNFEIKLDLTAEFSTFLLEIASLL